jgi:hypothetical protein
MVRRRSTVRFRKGARRSEGVSPARQRPGKPGECQIECQDRQILARSTPRNAATTWQPRLWLPLAQLGSVSGELLARQRVAVKRRLRMPVPLNKLSMSELCGRLNQRIILANSFTNAMLTQNFKLR